MAPKRPLGLGKAAKAKKQKKSEISLEPESSAQESQQPAEFTNELTVELSEEVNPDDPLAQLSALWMTWFKSEKDNELILNGIIHECDRINRNCKQNGGDEDIELTPEFYAIFGRSLADLANFHTEEDEDVEAGDEKPEEVSNISDYFENSLERIEDGLAKFSNSALLLFAKAEIILQRIPLEYISKMDMNSEKKDFPNMHELLQESLDTYESAVKICEQEKNFEMFNNESTLEILNSLDDLLDIIDNFGKQNSEGLDSDHEESSNEDLDDIIEEVELSKKHPLYKIQNSDKFNSFWRTASLKHLSSMNKTEKPNPTLKRKLAKKIGQSYMMEAEEPISIFTTLEYDSDNGDGEDEEGEINGLTAAQAQKIAKDLVSTALRFLADSWDEEDPQSWVDIAEAEIMMGNLFEVGSNEQESWYGKAEKKLKKANNATHGKYDDILNNLLNQEE
ncbi:hypothetical protein CANARDRAFT_5559 [[Candida] arabinofermentans NRRL YB-2248]|uniref:Enhancer of translation termination 1 n=1 Tax=[Candida] arabinofermentans NRRL YB-2248 TaxID=983967 RepID=A0A1E4T944_9ASCO|nr:hypothetical protein CANARDRAFT_5559 [[Candida] arabinofermentans NRRL YB-2248]